VSPIEPWALLAHAQGLTGAPVTAGAEVVDFRRAVSAAYYAVFHALSLAVARRLVPGSPDEMRYRIVRSVDHGRTREVLRWLTVPNGGREQVVEVLSRLRSSPALVELAAVFTDLHAARQRADYDHLAEIDARAAREACSDAARGLALLDGLAGSNDLDELLALVALNVALR
jgi:hypothetical protein